MKLKGVAGLVFATLFILISVLSATMATPVTDINKLPSITTDTLLQPQVEEDTETAESTMGFLNTMVQGTKLLQRIARPREEATYVTLFRLPWRIARSVSQSSFGMAKGFMDAFSHHFMETYKDMQKNVIPQASEALSQWANPPQTNNLDTPWLDGGV